MEKDEFFKLKKILSLNIKKMRKERGLAQERLGLDSGVDRTLISKIERQIANP
jgi:transcriptional regulator with XRE-family HTH domain